MSQKTLIVLLLVASAAVAGVGALLLRDDGKVTPSPASAEPARRGTAPGDGFAPLDRGAGPEQGGSARGGTGSQVALSPQETQALTAALEKLAEEASTRAQLTEGVPQPWPIRAAQATFRSCLVSEKWSGPTGPGSATERACACATREVQKLYPKEPPNPGTRNAIQAYERSVRERIAACNGE